MSQDMQFQQLFEGYQLVRVADRPPSIPVEKVETSNLEGAYPLEPSLVPGRVYVFRKTNPMANETMALEVFPKRLAAFGAHIVTAPKSSQDLIKVFIGGPIFTIEFEKDGRQGKLFNRVHTSEVAGDTWEELILVYT